MFRLSNKFLITKNKIHVENYLLEKWQALFNLTQSQAKTFQKFRPSEITHQHQYICFKQLRNQNEMYPHIYAVTQTTHYLPVMFYKNVSFWMLLYNNISLSSDKLQRWQFIWLSTKVKLHERDVAIQLQTLQRKRSNKAFAKGSSECLFQ